MKSPYGPLLSLRELEEKQAEACLAGALHEVGLAENALTTAQDARDAWLQYYLDEEPGDIDATGLSAVIARLETSERDAAQRLEAALRRADEARTALLERRRDREAVQTLHTDLLEAMARESARRQRAELDELGGVSANVRKEASDAR
jgi:flagellar export protein FliJ